MAVRVVYDEDCRLSVEGLECDCGYEHSAPGQDIYVGRDLLDKTPHYIKKRGLGTRCVLVCDKNTYEAAGRRVEQRLAAEGFSVILCRIMRQGDVDPDETAVGEVLLSIQPDTQFLISVGSGSLTDITRVNAKRTGLPFVAVGTAPSMDGYTSVVAPLLLRGCKIHRAGNCPEIIVCDLGVMMKAPYEMIVSGVGDVLGKYIAKADWLIGSVINGERFCPICGEIVTGAVDKLVDSVELIRTRSEEGVRILIEALLLAGITIMIIGQTRAVSSIEHNIVHLWDMHMVMRGKRAPKHGASVGVSTLMCWPIFKRFAGEDLSRLDIEGIQARAISREERMERMEKAWTRDGAHEIALENEGDFLTWDEQLRRIRTAQERCPEIKAIIDAMPSLDTIRSAMERLGAPMTPADVGVDADIVPMSFHAGKDYRTRYTLFKLLDECGLLEEYLADYPFDWSAYKGAE